MPKISVVIPVYNGEKTIQQTVESVLCQTFQDIEILIINDGSSDRTLEILNPISDSRLKIHSFPNAGLAASRNRGIDLAQGDYISFIDADDLWTPDKLQDQLNALEADSQAGLAYSWTDFIDETGNFLRPGGYARIAGNVYRELLLSYFIESGSNILIRKEIIARVGYFDESLQAAEDWDFALRVASCYPIVVVPKVQVLYRQTTVSMSAKISRQETETLKVLEKAYSQAPEHLKPNRKISLGNLYQYLTFRSLESVPNRQQALNGIHCLSQVARYSPSFFWQRRKLSLILLIKILVGLTLPPTQAKLILSKLKSNS